MENTYYITAERMQDRALGCLHGHIFGAAMSGSVFPARITEVPRLRLAPTLAGEPQGDELLLLQLARILITRYGYRLNEAIATYMAVEECSQRASCTPGTVLRNDMGPLIRVPPLGIWGAQRSLGEVAQAAHQDARLTHPHPLCGDANAVYAVALALALSHKGTARQLYRKVMEWTADSAVDREVLFCLAKAELEEPDADHGDNEESAQKMLHALHNAFWQLLHTDCPAYADSPAYALIRTGALFGMWQQEYCAEGAIAGALLGALHGARSFPHVWRQALNDFVPTYSGTTRLKEQHWPVDLGKLIRGLMVAAQ